MHWWWSGVLVVNVGVVAACLGLWRRALRQRAAALVSRELASEDRRERRRRALDIHDNVVQGLVTAKLYLELEETDAGMAKLAETLEAARQVVTDLLGDGEAAVDLRDGALRRAAPTGPIG